jgi:Na+-translocating ferredoxin:NAD+ oxidoreductase RnfD subunit
VSANAVPAPGRALVIRGKPWPVLLPKPTDPRLHLAAVITSLHVLGQVAFDFRLSIAQILLSILTAGILEVAITARRQHVLMWPASALITGNGVAFILRVPGTEHGDWWSLHGWWIYVGTSAVSLLSKYAFKWRGGHVFNPSNFGLVVCFLVLGRTRAEPLDFWWGPMSPWLLLAFAIIVSGGIAILSRLRLLAVAVSFWLAFAAGIGVLAATGHAMTARWHLGPLTGFDFWLALLTSPEILVFLFFMITDPKTIPGGRRARIAFSVGVGLLAALLIAPLHTEWATKVAVLASLTLACGARPLLAWLRVPRVRVHGRRLAAVGAAALAVYAGALVTAGVHTRSAAEASAAAVTGKLPAITILPSRGVSSRLDVRTAREIVAALPAPRGDRVSVWLEPGKGQDPAIAVAQLSGRKRVELEHGGAGWAVGGGPAVRPAATQVLAGFSLENVAPKVGLDFTQGAFRTAVTNDAAAMMGGGVCWLDYDGDGWLDLFAVNSYADAELPYWQEHGGTPESALFHNVHGRFVNVTRKSRTGLPLRGEGCVAADLDGDGHTDLYVTTAVSDVLLWNNGDGTFTEGARKAGVVSFGWHSGAAVADVNGDGRVDLFVAGYTDMHHEIAGSTEGFPGNHEGVRDLLFLNEGNRRFREVGARVGLDRPHDHGLGAVFSDVNRDGRPDLYVANDEDPNRLYVNERGGPLGFRFVERARAERIADPNAGMGIAEADYSGDGRPDLMVSNSRRQTHAFYESDGARFRDVRGAFTPALGTSFTGWGNSWSDFDNDGRLDLALANGAIPVTNLGRDAGPVQVLAQRDDGSFVGADVVPGLRLNGRGLAAADYDNDGRVDLAVGSIGGRLALLRNTAPRGHWVEVAVAPFSPGAVVTATLADGRRMVREVQAGSSYLSSEDPRVHFGLGDATSVAKLTVRYPDGTTKRLANVRGNRIVTVPR